MATQQILSQIKRLRKDRGFSQAEMAASLHVALKTYQNIERGFTRIDIELLEQISEVLDSELHSLMGMGEGAGKAAAATSREKELYRKIIQEKEIYITQLEESVRFYREILRERMSS